jgi:hypothetical protein
VVLLLHPRQQLLCRPLLVLHPLLLLLVVLPLLHPLLLLRHQVATVQGWRAAATSTLASHHQMAAACSGLTSGTLGAQTARRSGPQHHPRCADHRRRCWLLQHLALALLLQLLLHCYCCRLVACRRCGRQTTCLSR